MILSGQIRKMTTVLGNPVQYYLNLGTDLLHINHLIGNSIELKHIGYQCVNCNSSETIFRMGFCKKCFFESPYASDTILKPELSTAHLGIEERDLQVEQEIQLQPHIVYLAYTGDVKVGVTRQTQVPTRWIDQGATFALPIARTQNRYEAGMIEVELKKHFADKTNWRKMLQDEREDEVDFQEFLAIARTHLPEEYQHFLLNEASVTKIDYPYQAPEKIQSIALEKNPDFSGILSGIKGQYICFVGGYVINIRSHEGFVVQWKITKA